MQIFFALRVVCHYPVFPPMNILCCDGNPAGFAFVVCLVAHLQDSLVPRSASGRILLHVAAEFTSIPVFYLTRSIDFVGHHRQD